MKNWNTQSTVETIGLLAVVLSLIFVGLELRQNSIATIAQTNSNVAESFIDINLAMATSEELARALTGYGDDPANLSAADVVQVLGLWRALFHIWSNAHRQHLSGTLDPAIYAAMIAEISHYAVPGADAKNFDDLAPYQRLMRWAWESERYVFNPDFQVFVDDCLGIER